MSEAITEAWAALSSAARQFNDDPTDPEYKRRLSDAALAWGAAKRGVTATAPSAPAASNTNITLPFGRSKGRPLREAPTDDLKWILPKIQHSVDDPEKARWRDANAALVEAIQAELELRS